KDASGIRASNAAVQETSRVASRVMMEPSRSADHSWWRLLIGPLYIICPGVYPRAIANWYSVSDTTSAQSPRSRINPISQGRGLVLNEYDKIAFGQWVSTAFWRRVTKPSSLGTSRTRAGVGGWLLLVSNV